jgi:hypothetical protein
MSATREMLRKPGMMLASTEPTRGKAKPSIPPWIVLQYLRMSHTLTIRLTEELLAWLKEMSRRTGLPVGRIIRQQLEEAKSEKGNQNFLRHAGQISGPPDLSSRKGFSRR